MARKARTRESIIARQKYPPMPLEHFPADKQAEIAAAVAAPKPPHKWIYLGPPDAPRPLAIIESRAWYEWHWNRGVDPDSKRDPLPASLRLAVIQRDGTMCQLCHEPVDRKDIHIDHIVPYSKGGPDTLENLQVTHSRCNIKKGARTDGA